MEIHFYSSFPLSFNDGKNDPCYINPSCYKGEKRLSSVVNLETIHPWPGSRINGKLVYASEPL